MKIIIYNDKNTNIPCILYQVDKSIDIIDVGKKDIDFGIPFWIIDSTEIPNAPQETWILEDMGDPSGYGERK